MKHRQEEARFAHYKELVMEQGSPLYAGKLLQRAAVRFGTNTALIFKDQTISYCELYARACRFSDTLKALGLQPRERVLLMIENSIDFYVAYFGIWQVGAVVAPLNVFLKETELAHIVRDAEPALVVTTENRKALFESFGCKQVVTESDIGSGMVVPAELPDYTIPIVGADEMVALLYTSGTTGFAKGVMLSSTNIMTNILQGISRLPLELGQRVFGVLPLFHSFAQFACVWGSMLTGCTVILVPKIDRRAIMEGVKHKPTIFLGVPALYGLLCLCKNVDLSSVKYFICGGDVLPDKIRMMFELVYRRKLCNGYGLTETTPVLAADVDDELCPTNTVGRPLIGVACSIRDESGKELPCNQIGVLWVKGDNVMLGYYKDPERTAAILKDGWLNTGDFARIDEQGKIVICGREKDIIAHKGIKIYPPEIENVLMMHQAVVMAGVIGRDDEESGQVPIAYVQMRIKQDGIEHELRELCRQHLANYKIPREFIIVETLPLTTTGKVDKKVLRKQT